MVGALGSIESVTASSGAGNFTLVATRVRAASADKLDALTRALTTLSPSRKLALSDLSIESVAVIQGPFVYNCIDSPICRDLGSELFPESPLCFSQFQSVLGSPCTITDSCCPVACGQCSRADFQSASPSASPSEQPIPSPLVKTKTVAGTNNAPATAAVGVVMAVLALVALIFGCRTTQKTKAEKRKQCQPYFEEAVNVIGEIDAPDVEFLDEENVAEAERSVEHGLEILRQHLSRESKKSPQTERSLQDRPPGLVMPPPPSRKSAEQPAPPSMEPGATSVSPLPLTDVKRNSMDSEAMMAMSAKAEAGPGRVSDFHNVILPTDALQTPRTQKTTAFLKQVKQNAPMVLKSGSQIIGSDTDPSAAGDRHESDDEMPGSSTQPLKATIQPKPEPSSVAPKISANSELDVSSSDEEIWDKTAQNIMFKDVSGFGDFNKMSRVNVLDQPVSEALSRSVDGSHASIRRTTKEEDHARDEEFRRRMHAFAEATAAGEYESASEDDEITILKAPTLTSEPPGPAPTMRPSRVTAASTSSGPQIDMEPDSSDLDDEQEAPPHARVLSSRTKPRDSKLNE